MLVQACPRSHRRQDVWIDLIRTVVMPAKAGIQFVGSQGIVGASRSVCGTLPRPK